VTTTTDTAPVPINTIAITEKAARKVSEFAAKAGKNAWGLKVGVKGGGCSGLTYVLDIVDSPADDDKIIEQHNVRVFVPKKSFVFLAGMTLDFSDGLNGKGFQFHNPNARKTCGCGTSFGV
jgi:iron-sulfur cluster assembly protein